MLAGLRLTLISWLALLPAVLGTSFESCVLKQPPQRAQVDPSWLSTRFDFAWKSVARTLAREAARRRTEALARLAEAARGMRNPPEIPELAAADADDMNEEGTYGKLPEIRVDVGHGAIFPQPLQAPNRFSWFQTAMRAGRALRDARKLERALDHWLEAPDTEKAKRFARVAELLDGTAAALAQVGRETRYLELWVGQHLRGWREARESGEKPPSYRVASALASREGLEQLRDFLRPRRVIERSFLPERLEQAPGGILILPIATDIFNTRFLEEIEGAIATHWNQSPWARRVGVSIHVHWTPVGRDKAFAAGAITLEQHLARFPRDRLILTTGGLTVHVRDRALVLGPGKVQPRTLAHEIGHLLGFGDCYLRTLSSQGVFGLGVLEWDNPLYPDDLMCDNSVGVARAEVW